ncbi:hypothetical protein LUU34_00702500 [Aix galericulata]|nr:hypothetical protein LUU34_00702500 [Aix galericulata]
MLGARVSACRCRDDPIKHMAQQRGGCTLVAVETAVIVALFRKKKGGRGGGREVGRRNGPVQRGTAVGMLALSPCPGAHTRHARGCGDNTAPGTRHARARPLCHKAAGGTCCPRSAASPMGLGLEPPLCPRAVPSSHAPTSCPSPRKVSPGAVAPPLTACSRLCVADEPPHPGEAGGQRGTRR